jgi:hypothetical protein
MRRNTSRRKTVKKQENVSVLSFSAICIAAALLKSVATNCTADNLN